MNDKRAYSMTTLKELLLKTHENLLILQEREAKYSGNAPLELFNQIRDHQKAIDLIEQALSSELTETSLENLKEALRPLLVASNIEMIDLDTLKPEIPPLPFEPETTLIPAGPFLMGSQPGEDVPKNETPQHEVRLRTYRIGLYPVTNEQYAEFVKQAKHPTPKKTGWFGKTPPKNKLDHPAVGVSWNDALAYCRWLSEQTGRAYRLPTEAEWEKAARGDDGRIYPWGNAWKPGCCNCANTETTSVTAFPTGQSPYGCLDLIGNVWEWTSTLWGPDWQESDFPYPYQPNDGREDLTADATVHRVFRGGSFADEVSQLRCSVRRWYAPDHADKACGFRVVLEVEA
jgi:formylglycine-generating enzyme required for sulfatase activity